MELSKAVVDRLYELCNAKNLTINKLCTISAVTQSTVNDIVNGVTKNMGIVTLKKLCDGLEISIADFFNTDIFRNLQQEIE